MYLIDGYNLLFAYLGAPPNRTRTKALERGRKRLLELVRTGHPNDLGGITVVFDAAHAPPKLAAEFDYHGIHVTFAVHDERADDLIESMIRRASAPRRLTVITDDRHIQQAARRRHCIVRGCSDYLNGLENGQPRAEPEAAARTSKPSAPSAEETKRWLGEFAHLERDPAMRELADLNKFGEEDS
jgi:predicted RNA-binding protein with PIN domain